MSNIDAWRYVTDNWNTPTWKEIREDIKTVLGLDSRVGMCNGMLVSRTGSRGMDEFIKRLNGRNGK